MVKKVVIISVVVVLLLIIGICWFFYGYVPSGERFIIKYSNLERVNLEGKAEAEKAELTDHGLTTRTNFMTPGDSLEYTFDVINDGTINARLKFDPIHLKLDYYTKKHINYVIAYADGRELKKGDILKAGETIKLRVTITYEKAADMATMDSQFYESNVYLMFLQKRF